MIKKRKIFRFNNNGIQKFNNLISNYNFDQNVIEINNLCENEEYTEIVSETIISNDFKFRFQAAKSIIDIQKFDFEDDGLWSWLSAHMRPSLAPDRFLQAYTYIPSTDYRHKSRHILKTACALLIKYGEKSKFLLDHSNINVNPDVLESFCNINNSELLEDNLVIDLINKVYIDPDTKKIKKGVAGGGSKTRPGQFRRLNILLKQLNLTHNLRKISLEELIDLLPGEYDKFLH